MKQTVIFERLHDFVYRRPIPAFAIALYVVMGVAILVDLHWRAHAF